MALIGGKRRSRKVYKKMRGGHKWPTISKMGGYAEGEYGSNWPRPVPQTLGKPILGDKFGGKRKSRKVGRKAGKGTKKGMRRKTARRAYKKLRGGASGIAKAQGIIKNSQHLPHHPDGQRDGILHAMAQWGSKDPF